jgi:integrase/recombinase XerD
MAAYLAELAAQGYQPDTIERHRKRFTALDGWLAENRGQWSELDEAMLTEFAREHWSRRGAARVVHHTLLTRFLAVVRTRGYVRAAPAVPVRTGSEQLLADFARYLTEDRGCVPSTVQAYQRLARAFVTEVTGRGACRPGRWRMAQVVAFVRDHLRVHGRTPNAHALTTALRSFFRFLQERGDLTVDLTAAVPRLPVWALASLPATLPAGGMATLLAPCDRTTALGQRDYALLVLLTHLGLRSTEVCHLRLDDLDWVEGSLRVRAGKSGHDVILPLDAKVGQALALYLERARPPCRCREVFVRDYAPRVGLTRQALYKRVRAAFARAGFTGLRQGAHTLRHSLASDLLRQGASLAEIAEVLGHRHLRTTAIYAKVDRSALGMVAMPWLGGAR